jgi:phosphate transport system permease protein
MTDTTNSPDTNNRKLKSSARIGSGSLKKLRSRKKARYASERRFKYLGLSAILVSVGFLVLLLATIVGSGIPAFTYNYVKLPVDLTKIEADNPADGNYTKPVRDSISEVIPYMSGRKDKRLARGIISGGASIEVRDMVVADTALAGQKTDIAVPVSDFADLYLKGLTAKPLVSSPQAEITISGLEDEVDITLDRNVFNGFLGRVKETIRAEAARLNTRMVNLQLSLDNQRQIVQNSENELAVESAKASVASLESQLAGFKNKYDALIARRDNSTSREILDQGMPSLLLKVGGGVVKVNEVEGASAKGEVLIPLKEAAASAGEWQMQEILEAEENRKFSDKEVAILDRLVDEQRIETRANLIFFTKGASREPELAGIWGAVVGSFFTMLITLALSFPLGVAAAIYLEEFAPKNKITAIIEVNINNLAAVPSIVFGLLGLAVFLNFFELPRSAPLVGGMVLALMTLPTIIIASRAALKAVPPSIREAALGVGASKIQSVFHHVLPLAMPGILTGTIIGMAQALGETAPLLMIGMVAFVVDIPAGIFDPATVLPVQIYMWADFPEPGFQQKTAAAIMVLLVFLVLMNALAVLLRKRFERRW